MNSNKPAYPTLTERGKKIKGDSGITKREWMAGMAMQGLLAYSVTVSSSGLSYDIIVEKSYKIADAMLKEGGNEK